MFVKLPFEEPVQGASAGAIAAALNQQYGASRKPYRVFPPPPVMGLGTIGGFRMQIEDRGGLRLAKQTNLLAKGSDPRVRVFSPAIR